MKLDITHEEKELLLEILEARYGEIREQVYHSSTSTFTDMLRHQESLVKSLIERVRSSGLQDRPNLDATPSG